MSEAEVEVLPTDQSTCSEDVFPVMIRDDNLSLNEEQRQEIINMVMKNSQQLREKKMQLQNNKAVRALHSDVNIVSDAIEADSSSAKVEDQCERLIEHSQKHRNRHKENRLVVTRKKRHGGRCEREVSYESGSEASYDEDWRIAEEMVVEQKRITTAMVADTMSVLVARLTNMGRASKPVLHGVFNTMNASTSRWYDPRNFKSPWTVANFFSTILMFIIMWNTKLLLLVCLAMKMIYFYIMHSCEYHPGEPCCIINELLTDVARYRVIDDFYREKYVKACDEIGARWSSSQTRPPGILGQHPSADKKILPRKSKSFSL